MGRTAPVARGFPLDSRTEDGHHAFKNLKSALHQPLILKTFSWNIVCIAWVFAMTSMRTTLAQDFSFSVPSTSYNCSSNMICLGEAHVYNGSVAIDSSIQAPIQAGRLSLVQEPSHNESAGLAYYNQPVKFLNLSTRQSVSFNTSFTIDMVYGHDNGGSKKNTGDGMAFVISANNSTIGADGSNLGFFDKRLQGTTFKSIVVEFDTYQNVDNPIDDISDSHVSFDFMTIAYAAAANTSNANVDLHQEATLYAWVEYSSQTTQLEVRISTYNRRPLSSLLSSPVNLSDVVEEYMWVGFSSSTGGSYSNFYVGSWTFESYEILAPSPGPAPSPLTGLVTTTAKSGGRNTGIIVGISVGIPIVLLAGIVIGLYVWKRSACRGYLGWWTTSTEEDKRILIEQMPTQFSYKQLSVATGRFNEESKLGEGGFGSVYRGVLASSGIPVAVKKISSKSTQGEKEFMTEVLIISQLRHRNLIRILGWCKDTNREKYLLVYELMPNGSLDKALFRRSAGNTACLSWKHRFKIVAGIAAALDYLHQGWNQQIVHRDVKSSNIMLDEEWNAKLGDFGLARLVDHQQEPATTLMAGTYGYIAPEVPATGKFTDKTDVYAFGAVVLEVACGRKALAFDLPEDEMILVDWVWHRLSVGDLMSTVDKRLEEYDADRMEALLIIGLLCSHPSPLARPSMRQVVQVLAGDAPIPSIPASKPVAIDVYIGASSDSQSGSSWWTSSVFAGRSSATQRSLSSKKFTELVSV